MKRLRAVTGSISRSSWFLVGVLGCALPLEEDPGGSEVRSAHEELRTPDAEQVIPWERYLPQEREELLMAALERGMVPGPPDFSRPLPGLTAEQRARFEAGAEAFAEVEDVADGLGPLFNDTSCGACHNAGGLGGGSSILESRFGRRADDGSFDSLQAQGGTLQQLQSIGSEGTPAGCFFPAEVIPANANVRTLRRSTPLFGLGLVDSVPDDTLRFVAEVQRALSPATAGHVAVAVNLSTSQPQVSRFGWKAQIPTLFQFSANAYNNEMGITTPLFSLENCPNDVPDCELARRCDPVPGVDDDNEDVQAFTDFMSFLAPPFRGPLTPAVRRGELLFTAVGCANCHLPTLVTGRSPIAALDRKVLHPYSDFLLHDMGASADGIGPDQGDATDVTVNATPTEMRTAPLWGLRVVERFMHDGRARTVSEAILAHEGQGAAARRRFARLGARERSDLLAFLQSL